MRYPKPPGEIAFKCEMHINLADLPNTLQPDQLEALMVGLAKVMAASRRPERSEREGAGLRETEP